MAKEEKDKEIIEEVKKAHEEFQKEMDDFNQKRKGVMKEHGQERDKQKIEELRKKLEEM